MNTATEPWVGRFQAMACPCEVLLDTEDTALAEKLFALAETEARRVEEKFSRYIPGSIVNRINQSDGQPVIVDEETAYLIDFADRCYQLSDGLFDITTGVLRRIWKFNVPGNFPTSEAIQATRALVGWDKVIWNNPTLTLRPGMEIDLGGIGKEYAVDRALGLIRAVSDISVLINFGGDIVARGPRKNGEPWRVGIEQVDRDNVATHLVNLTQGALTTSGDSKKYLLHEGRRYSHIFNPRTGYPVESSPRSVTVAAGTCTEAGFLSTMGMLMGSSAEEFLQTSAERSWCCRLPS